MNNMQNCVGKNQKTGRSLDFGTNCPKRKHDELHRDEIAAGLVKAQQCPYCYVKCSRDIGFNAKKVWETTYQGDLLRIRKLTIDKLNSCGGLRQYSFADYEEWHDPEIEKMTKDAQKIGLKLKAITKQPKFIEKWHDRYNVIHVSVDSCGTGVPLNEAIELRKRYKNVRIRLAVMSHEDVEKYGEIVDNIVFNHAINDFHKFTKAEIAKYAEKYPSKVCCQTGHCYTCKIKCNVEG